MKRYIRFISLILSLIMVTSVFAACNGDTPEVTTDDPTQESEVVELLPDIEKKNYGKEFYLPIHGDLDHYYVEERLDDVVSVAVYNRQEKVKKYLGVEIISTETLGHDEYGAVFMTSVKNKDGSVHAIMTNPYMSLTNFISGNYLRDYNDMPAIDLNADYWNLDMMEGVAANDHLYLGASDYKMVSTYVVTFNKEMLDKYSDALDEPIYDTVTNYRWTLDKMISLASLVYIDQGEPGKTEDDIFGITGWQWQPFINFLQASNIQLVEQNERGVYEVSVYNAKNKEKTTNIIDKLNDLVRADYSWFNYKLESTPVISMTSNRTLLYISLTHYLSGLLKSDVEFGVLPYPMYDENQKNVGYRSLDWSGWLCIPSYLEDEQMVGETLEMLAYYSDDVVLAYYEKMLGKQVADAPDDKKMLDIIWDSICSDVGLTYSNMSVLLDINLYLVPQVTYINADKGLAAYVQQYEKQANSILKKFFKELK